jgi:hypothetical protein
MLTLGVSRILITNRNHLRAANAVRGSAYGDFTQG